MRVFTEKSFETWMNVKTTGTEIFETKMGGSFGSRIEDRAGSREIP
jgi:hypothetical protein